MVNPEGNCLGSYSLKAVGVRGAYGIKKLYEVCYDEQRLITLYTVHTIYGQTIYRTQPNNRKDDFRATGMPNQLTESTLTNVYAGPNTIGGNNIAIHRGHLSPWIDQIFQNFRIATNLYINVVPQANTNNVGNWKQIESLTHAMAGALHDNLIVVQGTYTKRGETEYISNTPRGFHDRGFTITYVPVPQFLWKLLKVHGGKEILFVTLNRKFLTSNQAWDIGTFCTSWCGLFNLQHFYNEGPNGNSGVVACCSADDVLRRHSDFPLPRHLISDHGSHWASDDNSLPDQPEWLQTTIDQHQQVQQHN